jgi:hypothetical protein
MPSSSFKVVKGCPTRCNSSYCIKKSMMAYCLIALAHARREAVHSAKMLRYALKRISRIASLTRARAGYLRPGETAYMPLHGNSNQATVKRVELLRGSEIVEERVGVRRALITLMRLHGVIIHCIERVG